jgi:hypothetical protein
MSYRRTVQIGTWRPTFIEVPMRWDRVDGEWIPTPAGWRAIEAARVLRVRETWLWPLTRVKAWVGRWRALRATKRAVEAIKL